MGHGWFFFFATIVLGRFFSCNIVDSSPFLFPVISYLISSDGGGCRFLHSWVQMGFIKCFVLLVLCFDQICFLITALLVRARRYMLFFVDSNRHCGFLLYVIVRKTGW